MCVAILCHMQDLSSPTRDWTHAPCSGRLEPESLDYQGGPPFSVLLRTIHAAQVHFNHYLSICKHILTSSGNGPVIQGTRFPLEGRGLRDTESGPQRLEEHTALPRVAEPGGSVPTLPTDVISLVPHICYWGNTTIQCHSKRKIPALLLFSHQVMSILFMTPWTTTHQASLSLTISQSLPKIMSIKSVMPSNHLILCCPLLVLPSIFPSIRVFSNESSLHIRWPKCWSFSFSISPSNEYLVLIFFRTNWFDLAVQGTLKSLQHHSSEASILWPRYIHSNHHKYGKVALNLP